jgi:hypothetical protein
MRRRLGVSGWMFGGLVNRWLVDEVILAFMGTTPPYPEALEGTGKWID